MNFSFYFADKLRQQSVYRNTRNASTADHTPSLLAEFRLATNSPPLSPSSKVVGDSGNKYIDEENIKVKKKDIDTSTQKSHETLMIDSTANKSSSRDDKQSDAREDPLINGIPKGNNNSKENRNDSVHSNSKRIRRNSFENNSFHTTDLIIKHKTESNVSLLNQTEHYQLVSFIQILHN